MSPSVPGSHPGNRVTFKSSGFPRLLLAVAVPLPFLVLDDFDRFTIYCSEILWTVLQLGFVHFFVVIRPGLSVGERKATEVTCHSHTSYQDTCYRHDLAQLVWTLATWVRCAVYCVLFTLRCSRSVCHLFCHCFANILSWELENTRQSWSFRFLLHKSPR